MVVVACGIRKLYPIVSWYCLSAYCIVVLREYYRLRWCICLALWRRIIVTAQYVIGGGWGFWFIVHTQDGTVLLVILYL